MADLKIIVTGAAGRMGGAIIRAIAAKDGLALHAAVDRQGAEHIGADAGTLSGLPAMGLLITDDLEGALAGGDVIIDFTTPQTSVAIAQLAAKAGLAHVIGTTGCSEADEAAFHAAAKSGARIVKSGNMSLGVNLLASLVKQAASGLGSDFDIEVVEMHHNRKVDAPSGTALMLGEAAAKGRDIDLAENAVRVRDGITGARQEGTIGFATLRGGTVVGEHSVMFAGPAERITLTHSAEDRSLFANGAVHAAQWISDKKPGYYSMADVLGLDT